MSTSNDALHKLLSVRPGEHDIIVYENLGDFGKIYSQYCKHLLEYKNHVVFLLIFTEDRRTVLDNLEQEGIYTNGRLKDGSLLIEEIAQDLFCSKDAMLRYFSHLKGYSKNIGREGMVILFDISCLYLFGDDEVTKLTDFESNIFKDGSHILVEDSSLLCCYPIAIIGKLKEHRDRIS